MLEYLVRRPRRKRVPARSAGVMFALFGLVVLGIFGYRLLVEAGSNSWPHVAGEIVSASAYRSGGKQTHYGINVVYRYSVDGRSLTGKRYGLLTNELPESDAYRIAGELTPEKPVWVYHSPSDPAECCLEPGASSMSWIGILFGVLPLGVGVVLVRYGPALDAKYPTKT